ncbi:MAG: site-2 protease family protein [Clostridiales bacterium]|nr:site-2 protease family protein [Clostridiales bacterium]
MFIYRLVKSGYGPKEIAFVLLLYVLALSIAFSFHEFMHAFVAYKLGDDTPKLGGRVTLNPLAHIDIMGFIMLFFVGIGWGKPVVWNPNRVTKCKPRTAEILVSLAGVTGNFILALIGSIIQVIIVGTFDILNVPLQLVIMLLYYIAEINLILLAFNLLPIPPLDGFRLVDALLPVKAKYTAAYKGFMRYSPMALFALILLGSVANINMLSAIIEKVEWPFRFVIDLVCKLFAIPFSL